MEPGNMNLSISMYCGMAVGVQPNDYHTWVFGM
jgi:hypothetical protein